VEVKAINLLRDWANALRALDKLDWESRGFNMVLWCNEKLPETPELGCGTVCCAYGVATTLPSWKEAGIKLERKGSSWTFQEDAWEKLGLSVNDFHWITNPEGYDESNNPEKISPSLVAERIEEIMEDLQ